MIILLGIAIALGILAAIAVYSYQKTLQFLYQFTYNLDGFLAWVKRKYKWLKDEIYFRYRLPELKRQTKDGSDRALAERLLHTAHERKYKNGDFQLRRPEIVDR